MQKKSARRRRKQFLNMYPKLISTFVLDQDHSGKEKKIGETDLMCRR